MMTVPPINDLLQKVDCRYTLAVEAAKRARELIPDKVEGKKKGEQPMETKGTPYIPTKEGDKPLTIAIEEINKGFISYERADKDN